MNMKYIDVFCIRGKDIMTKRMHPYKGPCKRFKNYAHNADRCRLKLNILPWGMINVNLNSQTQ